MRVGWRIAILTTLAVAVTARGARASVINVAEFNWTSTLIDPNPNCDALDPTCVPAPLFQSVFQLTNIWDGLDAPPTLVGSTLTLSDNVAPLLFNVWFDLAPPNDPSGINVDQLSTVDVLPLFAEATIAFAFAGQNYTLNALLSAPDTSQVLSIDIPDTPPAPVPEPGTLGLLAVGAAAGWSRARRIRTPQH